MNEPLCALGERAAHRRTDLQPAELTQQLKRKTAHQERRCAIPSPKLPAQPPSGPDDVRVRQYSRALRQFISSQLRGNKGATQYYRETEARSGLDMVPMIFASRCIDERTWSDCFRATCSLHTIAATYHQPEVRIIVGMAMHCPAVIVDLGHRDAGEVLGEAKVASVIVEMAISHSPNGCHSELL